MQLHLSKIKSNYKMKIITANVTIKFTDKGKEVKMTIKDFVTCDTISEYGHARLKQFSKGNDFKIIKFEPVLTKLGLL